MAVGTWVRAGLLAVVVAGCGDAAPGDGTDASTGSGATTATTTSGTDTIVPDSSAANLIVEPDAGPTVACDIYDDDCPVEEKCMPYASDGSARPDATHCVPLAEFPGSDTAPCTVQEWTASGIDDCDRGLYCVVYDAETLEGTCTPFCSTNVDGDLVCDEPATCVGNPDILPRLCLTDCNPLMPSCPPQRGCYRVNDHFVCLADTSGPSGGFGDPCFFTNDCDASTFCADPPEFFECGNDDGCCTPFCDAEDPDASAMCPGAPMHMCVPLFDRGEGPIGLQHIGACLTGPEVD